MELKYLKFQSYFQKKILEFNNLDISRIDFDKYYVNNGKIKVVSR